MIIPNPCSEMLSINNSILSKVVHTCSVERGWSGAYSIPSPN
jgi:hypothetical protein